MRVLWNGEVLNEFGPSRGIRQEDHISLYFICPLYGKIVSCDSNCSG